MSDYKEQRFRLMRDTNLLKSVLHEEDNPVQHISAIRSCIEADEAEYLLRVLNNNTKAKIYSLICCFTFIPSIKCIEYLIAEGTPLDKTFENNPFNCTPMDYLNKYFPASNIFDGPRHNCLSRDAIYEAIERGRLYRLKKDGITGAYKSGKPPLIKTFRNSIISLLREKNV